MSRPLYFVRLEILLDGEKDSVISFNKDLGKCIKKNHKEVKRLKSFGHSVVAGKMTCGLVQDVSL
jgi:hypothetical protein